jgi:hypothetical protein
MTKVARYFASAHMLKKFFRAMNSLFVRCGEFLPAEGKHVQTPSLNLESKIVMLNAVH